MAPLASMVARLARDASARSRFALPAAAAVSRAACSGNLILGSRLFAALGPQINLTGDASKSKRQLFGCAQHGARRTLCTKSSRGFNFPTGYAYRNLFMAEEKDMESDEALWALYQRWCKHYNKQRDHDEMVRRFEEFKYTVREVHRWNNSDNSCRFGITEYSDTSMAEFTPNRPVISDEAHKRLKALGGFTIEFGPDRDDGFIILFGPDRDD